MNGGPKDFRAVAEGRFYSSGYVYHLPNLPAGKIERVPLIAFLKSESTSFDLSSEQPEYLTVTARLPNDEFGKIQVRW